MARFDFGALADWREIDPGELLAFAVVGDFRRISFDVMSDGVAGVFASQGEASWLVALGDGLLDVSFTVQADCGVTVFADNGSRIWVRTKDRPQLIDESGEASWASIEPRGTAEDDKFRRMILLMQKNTDRRLAEQQREYDVRLAAIQASPKDVVIESEVQNGVVE